jgi:uncharacterized protein DUF2786
MEKIQDKIRKLLRLARDAGASEHEAANALAMASRLMLEHNISHIGEEEDLDPVIKGQWMHVRRKHMWEVRVATATAMLFSCKSAFDEIMGSHYFVGRADNIAVCEETFPWICEQIEELYKEGLKTFRGTLNQKARAEFRKNFKWSAAVRVYRRVGEIVAANRGNIPDHKALVIIDQDVAKATEMLSGIPKKDVIVKTTDFGRGAGYAAGDAVKLQGDLKDKRTASSALRIGSK